MNIPNYQPGTTRTTAGVPKDAAWVDRYQEPRDAQMRALTQALQGQLSVANVNADVRTVDVHDDTAIIITHQLRGAAIAVALLSAEIDDYAHLSWQPVDTHRVSCTISFDSGPTEFISVNLLILGS